MAAIDREVLDLLVQFARGRRGWRRRCTATDLARGLRAAGHQVSTLDVQACLRRLHRRGRVVRIVGRTLPSLWRPARPGERPGAVEYRDGRRGVGPVGPRRPDLVRRRP